MKLSLVGFCCILVIFAMSANAAKIQTPAAKSVAPVTQSKENVSAVAATEDKSRPTINRKEQDELTKKLIARFQTGFTNKKDLDAFNKEIHSLGGKAVPALIEVMKNGKYSDKSRWISTFMLGRVMGKRAAPFIGKFAAHPSWVMRLASLKVLLALRQQEMAQVYAQTLRDDSLIVRTQALTNIRELKLQHLAPNVWAMLYDKRNYYSAKNATKRTNIIKDVIAVVGDLKFEKAKGPLLTMIQKDKYKDIFEEINTSLEKITGQSAPKGDHNVKKLYWSRYLGSSKTI